MTNSDGTFNKAHWKKNVSLFLGGQAVTLIGSSLVGYAIMWYVTLETQSGVVLTLFTVATMLPMFFISPFGGVWADRFNRKHLINVADASIAAVTLVIALLFSLGIENLTLLFVCSIVRSFGQGVQMPAVSALIPQITPEDKLVRVNGINSSIQSLSTLGSPALAGLLLTISPIQLILFIDVTTAIIGISILFFFVKVPVKVKEEKIGEGNTNLGDIKAGLRYIKEYQFLKRYFVILAFFYILLTPAMLLSPLQVTRDFGADVWRLTAVEIAFSVGMLLGGLVIAAWGGFKNKTFTLIAGTVLFGMTTVGLGISWIFALYLACIALSGLCVPIVNTPAMVIFQTKVDNDYMGRVMSIMTMIASLMVPLGMVIFGPLGDIIPLDYIMIGTGMGTVILGVYVIFDRIMREAGESDNSQDNSKLE
ncbi:MAG: MFS transporter [Clostridiales bacterium]|nr:MFS transporter [Clostridiales bacterium]